MDDVRLDIDSDQIIGVAGESGCGKTTLGLSIMKLLPPNARIAAGSIALDSEDCLKMTEREFSKYRWKQISMVFQGGMNSLNPVRTVGDQVSEAILLHDRSDRAEARIRVAELFAQVGIDPRRMSHYPHELSGGMRQRTMIAMAIACSPKLVIADEPVVALDVMIAAQILNLLKNLRESLHMSILLIAHDLSVIAQVCDAAYIMYAGEVVEFADVHTLFKNPLHPYTEALVQAFPSIRGKKRKLKSIEGSPPSLAEVPLGCRFSERCPMNDESCRERSPRLIDVSRGHFVACHHPQGWRSSA